MSIKFSQLNIRFTLLNVMFQMRVSAWEAFTPETPQRSEDKKSITALAVISPFLPDPNYRIKKQH